MRNFLLLSLLLLLAFGTAMGQTRYNAVAEWNGPYFRVINNPNQFQKVDDPVVDIPFSNPISVAGIMSGDNPQIFVADQGNNRIQLFEVPVQYAVLDATTAWAWTGIAPTAALEVTNNIVALDLWDDDETLYRVVKGSVILKVDGEIWTEVSNLTGYTADDKVFQIDYEIADGNFIEIYTPANSFSDGGSGAPAEDIEVYYAYAYNENLAVDGGGDDLAYGRGDIDYGLTTGAGATVKVQIDETVTNGINSIQSLRSIFAIPNLTTATTTELYILDMADDSDDQDEYLFMYTVTNEGVVNARPNGASNEKYDGLLSAPEAIFVADVDGHVAVHAAGTLHDITDVTAVTITDANQVTGHNYSITLEAGPLWTVTDLATGQVIVSGAYPEAAGTPFTGIPGLSLTLADYTTAETGELRTVRADYGRYIFIADSDNDRIKVLAMADVTAGDFEGDWLLGDEREAGATPDASTELQKTTPATASAARNWSFYTATFPIKEGSLNEITIGSDTWTKDPDNYLGNNGPDDQVFTVDYMTGLVSFGNGVQGAAVPLSQTVTYEYVTSIDIMRYGNSGAGAGQFNSPKGIAAIWNPHLGYFNVYVSDCGNNRVQKFALELGDGVIPATMRYITEWNTALDATDFLSAPGDLYVVRETGSDIDTVWIFVTDVANARVVAYRDVAFATGATTKPVFDRAIGSYGNALGNFMEPIGILPLPNGTDAFDLYVADRGRNMVQKFQKADPVTITLSETGISQLPNSFSPGGTYTITYTITGAFECGFVNFYYSPDEEFNSNAKLCHELNTITAAAVANETWRWRFADSPDGTPADGDYYIHARVVTCEDNEELARDATDNMLTIDSDLAVRLSLRDFFDGDHILLLQNNAVKGIDLTLDYPVGVTSIEVNGTYSSDMFEILAINLGNIFDLEGQATNVIFHSNWDAEAGTWSVEMSQTGDPDGCNVSPRGDVAIISIRAKSDMITPDNPLVVGSFAMNEANTQVVKYDGESDQDLGFNQMTVYGAYLGDIATAGADHGNPPNMTPIPSGSIGFADLMVWTRGWDGDETGKHDPISDLGPTTGNVPDKIMQPDGYLGVEDILALNTMFSWWATHSLPKMITTPTMDDAKMLFVETSEEGNYIRARAIIENVTDLKGARLLLNYNREQLDLHRVEDGGFLSSGEAQALTMTREFIGGVEICMSRMSRIEPAVSGSGVVLEVVFERKTKNFDLFFEYELANIDIKTIEIGAGKAIPSGESIIPEAIALLQNTPNPFNSATTISYVVNSQSHVKLTVHDILGTRVKTLVDGTRDAGKHAVTWDATDSFGAVLPSGEYILKMEIGDEILTRRMLYVK